ncbi:MAG TPA: FKBP-type peptidyl-prolyl cis-trans isomerase [Nitrospira sp.]|nr:FKBP-type peptidyl-prolyl cis-trans isomerase [Nitrospira sp.]
MHVTAGDVVSVEYVIRLEDEQVIDTTVGEAPLVYTHGQHEILRGLEAGLEGMAIGAAKRVTVMPVDGYGERHPEGLFEVRRDRVPVEAQRVGAKLETTAPDGRVVFPYVAEIKPEVIVLDLNHPLAGKTLVFDVRVIDIEREGSLGVEEIAPAKKGES